MDTNRLNNFMFRAISSHNKCWPHFVKKTVKSFTEHDLNIKTYVSKSQLTRIIDLFQSNMSNELNLTWLNQINSVTCNGHSKGGNKLRLYKTFKSTFKAEPYVKN